MRFCRPTGLPRSVDLPVTVLAGVPAVSGRDSLCYQKTPSAVT